MKSRLLRRPFSQAIFQDTGDHEGYSVEGTDPRGEVPCSSRGRWAGSSCCSHGQISMGCCSNRFLGSYLMTFKKSHSAAQNSLFDNSKICLHGRSTNRPSGSDGWNFACAARRGLGNHPGIPDLHVQNLQCPAPGMLFLVRPVFDQNAPTHPCSGYPLTGTESSTQWLRVLPFGWGDAPLSGF
jgi:hypothetical protein